MNNIFDAKCELAELALDAMQDTYFVFDPATGQAIAWNRAFREISGYSDEEIKHLKAPDSYCSKEDITIAQEAGKEVTNNGNVNFQVSLIAKDKRIHLFEYSASVMGDPSSDSKWIVSIGRNITKNQEIELHLKRSQTIYDKTAQISRIGVWELEFDESKLTWSKVTKEIHEVAPDYEPNINTAINFYKEGDSRLKIASVVSDALEHGLPYDVQLQITTAKGNDKWVRAIGIPERKNGKTKYLNGIFQDITYQKTAQKALIESEEKYRTLFEMSDDAILTLDKNSVISCNQATVDLFGCKSKEEFLSKHPRDLSPKYQSDGRESRIASEKMISIAYQTGKNFFEWTHSRMDGTTFPVEILLTPMKIDGRDIIQAIVRDISERKRAKSELQKAKEKAEENRNYLNNIINNIGDPIFVKDEQSKFLLVNGAFCNLLALTENEIIGKTLSENFESEEQDVFIGIDRQVLKDGKENINEELLTVGEGEALTISTRKTRFIDSNGKKHLIGVIRNFSKRKKIEQEILFKNALLEAQSEASIDGIVVVNAENTVVSVNKRLMEMWDIPEEIWLQGAHDKILPHALEQLDDPEEFLSKVDYLNNNQSKKSNDEIVLKNGRYFDRYSAPLYDSENKYHGRVWYFHEITEIKKTAAQILNALKEKKMLLQEVHHRVKNNLQIVWGLLDIQEKRTHNEAVKSVLLDSKGHVKTMALIHENLYKGQDFASIDLGKYIGKLILNIQSMSLMPGVQIDVQNKIGDIKLGLDIITPLALIINELVGNVFKHAFQGVTKGTIAIDLQQYEDQLTLTIQDDGIGLPEDFDASTAKSLGIRLVQNLCRQLDATFSIKNQNHGTRTEIKFHGKI